MIAKEKSEAEESLAEALPALEEARLALDDLNKNDVTEIRLEPCRTLCTFGTHTYMTPAYNIRHTRPGIPVVEKAWEQGCMIGQTDNLTLSTHHNFVVCSYYTHWHSFVA